MSNVLIGKTITSISLAADREAIKFEILDGSVEGSRGEIVAHCDADCCSYTWIEAVELPALGLPATVVSVEDLNLPDGKESTFHKNPDSLAFYGCKIVTDRGEIVIDYRNDSNGYYGGNLSWPGEYHYGGVYGQNNSKMEWQPVS